MNLHNSRVHRFITQAIFRHRTISSFTQKIPPEIVRVIFTFLSIPDQICLSLTCRYLYACFLSFLDAQKLHFHQLLPPETRPMLCRNVDTEKQPRIQLLCQLGNSRWKYCSECWNLHRHSAWHAPWFIWGSKEPRYLYSPLLYGRYGCMPYAGKVDICPCLTITFRDKLSLMETIKSVQEKIHDGYEYYYDNIIYHQSFSELRKFIGHNCTFTSHPLAKVQINTEFFVDKEDQTLCVVNRYQFEILRENVSQMLSSGMKAPSMFPFKDTGDWIRRFFNEAGSSFAGCRENRYFGSFICFRETSRRGNEPIYSFHIIVKRNLGHDKWPDKIWVCNRRN